MAEHFYAWRLYHPDNWKPDKISGASYTEPPVNEDHEYLIDVENDEGEFDGYLIATLTDQIPTVSEYWGSRGWLLERRERWNKVDLSPGLEERQIVEIIEVHNVWAVYGLHEDGTPVDQPIAEPARPQDWGDPRWHYERFRFEWQTKSKHYINHAHCWTDIKELTQDQSYPHLFASLIVTILMPGTPEELCGKDYLAEDDFWSTEWGDVPEIYAVDEDYEYDE